MRYVLTNGAVLTIAGGLPVIVGGSFETFNGSHWAGIGNGLFIVGVGVLMILFPDNLSAWGILAIALAVASLFTAVFGGYLIGFLLTLLGGIYARRYRVPDVGGTPPGTMIPSNPYGTSARPTVGPFTAPPSPVLPPAPGQPLVAAPPLGALFCPWCGRPARYVPEYARYYCDTERRYL